MPPRPNILQITTHDSGRHLGCYGYPTLHTPHIDALAADGVLFGSYFATVPICCASRASMLTGRYPQSHGLMDLCFPPFDWALHADEQHLAHILHQAGYETSLFGMQHEVQNLERLRFDVVRAPRLPCDQVARELTDYLERDAPRARPFYTQVGFFETHTPFDYGGVQPDTSRGVEVPPYLLDNDTARGIMALYQGAIRKVDDALGVIVEALRRSGREQDTIVIFTTDHGIEMPRSKWYLYDPGIAVGLVLRYPAGGLTGGKRCDLLMSNVDYLSTLLDLAGVKIPARVQGQSYAAALSQERPAPLREAIYALYHKTQSRCVRTERFKLIRHFDAPTDFAQVPVRYEDVLAKRGIKRVELYDLQADPNEFHTLADQPSYAEVQARLDDLLWQWMRDVRDPLLEGPVRTPSYEAAMQDYARWQGRR